MEKSQIDLTGHVTEDMKLEASQIIADRLWRLVAGDVHDPATWENAARLIKIGIFKNFLPGGERGRSQPKLFADSGLVGGFISINTAYTEREQCETWVHELSHLIMAAWLPPQLLGNSDAYSYEGDADEVAHEVARMVERIFLGELD